MQLSRRVLRATYASLESSKCFTCQWRSYASKPAKDLTPSPKDSKSPSKDTLSAKEQKRSPPPSPQAPLDPLDSAPRAYGKKVDSFTPKPLSRPIGLPTPPSPGEHTGIDTRTWRQRRDDFVNYDKHIARRKQLTEQISTPYFREWSIMRHHKGKSFLAPPALFKAAHALFFPNTYGQTLLKTSKKGDEYFNTTTVLRGKVSVVSVYSSQWAENQAQTFVGEKQNPELHEVLKAAGPYAQLVRVNIEENRAKAWLIRLWRGSLRKRIGEQNWGRYFLVQTNWSHEIRDVIGLLNSKVGYTYLLDAECRIRWAASGDAEEGEAQGLVKGLRRLVDEAREPKKEEKETGSLKGVADTQKPVQKVGAVAAP